MQITKITAAEFAARFPLAHSFEVPNAIRPMVEVHKATGSIYPRTRANFERTRRMAAKLGADTVRKMELCYDVFELVDG